MRLVVLLGALSAFGPLSMDLYLPGLPQMARDLDAPASVAQGTLTACVIGLAVGQVVAGPISDALGRRRPLLVGLFAYALASAGCALAPEIASLTVLRLVQGLAGAVGIVLSRAVVRDLYAGAAAARTFAALILVNGLAPVLAPVLGGQLLHVTDWRGVFAVLSGIGVLLTLATWWGVEETLPPERRRGGGLKATLMIFGELLRDRRFVGYVLAAGLAFGAMFAYISGSPFVLEEIYGASPQAFSAVFAVNALGIVALGAVSRRLVGRVGPAALLSAGVSVSALGGVGLLVAVLAGAGLPGVLPALFAVVASIGLVYPNAAALAMERRPDAAGSASALIGLVQFALGALATPLVGLGGAATALPMAIVVATFSLGAWVTRRALA